MDSLGSINSFNREIVTIDASYVNKEDLKARGPIFTLATPIICGITPHVATIVAIAAIAAAIAALITGTLASGITVGLIAGGVGLGLTVLLVGGVFVSLLCCCKDN